MATTPYMEQDACLARWPRLARTMQWVGILSSGEVACTLQALHAGTTPYPCEATMHYGGAPRLLRDTIRMRHMVMRLLGGTYTPAP